MKRNAFTLFELMIVIVIIGVIYALVLSNFNTKKKVRIHHIEDIKEALLPYWTKGQQIDFYLYDTCQKSALFLNDVHQEELEVDIDNHKFEKIEIYKPDYRGESQQVEYTPIMIDKKQQKVCFKYTIFPNGSNSSYILKKEKRYYTFFPYFLEVSIDDDLQEAMDKLQQDDYRGVTPDEIHD